MATTPTIDYTTLDFDALKAELVNYISAQSEFTDHNFRGSNLDLLTSLLAYVTTLLAYNLNTAVNENYLTTATLRQNILKIMKLLNYEPYRKNSAQIFCDLTNIVYRATSYNIYKYDYILSGTKKFYYIGDTLDLLSATSKTGVNFFEGTLVQSNTEYTGNGLSYQSFAIADSEVGDHLSVFTYNTITFVKTYWTEFSPFTIYNDAPNDSIFFPEETSTGYTIRFGDGVLGRVVASNEVIGYEYLRPSNSIDSNNLITYKYGYFTDISNIQTVTVSTGYTSSFGAKDRESIDEMKFIAPKWNTSVARAVTADDYYTLAVKHPWIDNAQVIGGDELIPKVLGTVYITVKPDLNTIGNENFNTTQITTLTEYFKKYAVITISPVVRNPQYIYLNLQSLIRYTGVKPSGTLISTGVADFINVSNDKFGQYLEFSKFNTAVDESDALISSSINTLEKYALVTSEHYYSTDLDGNYIEDGIYALYLSKFVKSSFITRIEKVLISSQAITATYTQDVDYTLEYLDDQTGTWGNSGSIKITFIGTGIDLGISQTGSDLYEFRLFFETQDQDIFLNNGQIFFIEPTLISDGLTFEKIL